MSKRLVLLFMFVCTIALGQTGKIQMTYDAAGNQITRHYIQVFRVANPNIKDVKEISDNELHKSDLYDDLKYYPNPVSEHLYVRWGILENNFVSKISIYSMSGQLLKEMLLTTTDKDTLISFESFPVGYYNVALDYQSGERKTLKVIKK